MVIVNEVSKALECRLIQSPPVLSIIVRFIKMATIAMTYYTTSHYGVCKFV